MNDREHFRKKFRTQSTLKEEYGKKLKSGKVGVGSKDTEEKLDPERKKDLRGRAESEEMLGVKAQMKAESARIKALQAAGTVVTVGNTVIGAAAEVVAAGRPCL